MEKNGIFTISTSRVLPAKRWQVLRLVTRIEDFPRYLPNILESKVLSRERDRVVSSWLVEMEKVPLSWKEEEVLDLRQGMIHFKALSGDLERFEGFWKVAKHPSGGTELFLEVTLKIGIPVFEVVAGGIIAGKVRSYFDSLLKAFENELTKRRYHEARRGPSKKVAGFAAIGHPYNYQHLVHCFRSFKKDLRLPSREFLTKLFELTPSYVSHGIPEFRGAGGKATHGAFIACNIIPDMLTADIEQVISKVVESCKVAEKLGLGIVSLGGFTSIAGERGGEAFLKRIHVPVTTGNTLTAALAIEQVKKAAELMELDLSSARATILGGAGDIGSACARGLAGKVREITVTSRTGKSFGWIKREIAKAGKAKVRTSLNNRDAVRNADIVIAAASAAHSIVDIADFKSGAIVCDIGYPKNIAYTDTDRRDILIFSGGICSLPQEFKADFDIGMPSPQVLFGCFSEAIVLALEERFENFSWGKGSITLEKMAEILGMARKHGFELAPFFWGDRQVSDEEIRAIKIKT